MGSYSSITQDRDKDCCLQSIYFDFQVLEVITSLKFNYPLGNSMIESIQKFQIKFLFQSSCSFAVNFYKILLIFIILLAN